MFYKYTGNQIAFGFFTVILILYWRNILDDKLLLGAFSIVVTFYFGYIKHKIENDKMFKELFESFNNKYDEKFNDLINKLMKDEKMKLSIDERNLVIDYFNLCSEEFLWYSKGRIPQNVWKAWKAGINENLKIGQIKEIYEEETSTTDKQESYYGLYEELMK